MARIHLVSRWEACGSRCPDGVAYLVAKGGLRRLVDFNNAGLLRLFWLVASGDHSLWSRWIRRQYLRSKSLWQARPPSVCSWAWRGVLRVRDLAQDCFFHKIGDGTTIRFFLDGYHNARPPHP